MGPSRKTIWFSRKNTWKQTFHIISSSISYWMIFQAYSTGWWFQPIWKTWKSVGMIIPKIRKNKTCSKPPTSTPMISYGLRFFKTAEQNIRWTPRTGAFTRRREFPDIPCTTSSVACNDPKIQDAGHTAILASYRVHHFSIWNSFSHENHDGVFFFNSSDWNSCCSQLLCRGARRIRPFCCAIWSSSKRNHECQRPATRIPSGKLRVCYEKSWLITNLNIYINN